MDDFRDQYNDQFSENNWAQHIICHIDVFKSPVSNMQRVLKMGIKRDPLKAVVTFLKNKFSDKYPQAAEHLNFKQNPTKMEMVDQIYKFVYFSAPHVCLKCSQSYCPYTQPSFDDAVTCFWCKIPSHADCCKSDDVDTGLGVVFLCKHCINMDTSRFREDPSTPQKSPSSPEESPIQPAQPPKKKSTSTTSSSDTSESLHTPRLFTTNSDSDDRDIVQKVKPKRKAKKKSKPQNESDSESSSCDERRKKSKTDKEKTSDNKKLCRFFERGICRFGVTGKRNGKCKFSHPPMCKRILNHGPKSPHGCKGDCDKWHPKLCYGSINNKECYKESCGFWHIKGTIRSKNEGQEENKTNPQLPTQSKEESTPFLEQIQSHLSQVLNQQQAQFKQEMLQMAQFMNQMNRQIQTLARPQNLSVIPQLQTRINPPINQANLPQPQVMNQ